MPKRTSYCLRWSPQAQAYELFAANRAEALDLVIGSDAWLALLSEIPSFAFVSRTGTHCTIQKETVRPNGIYWYGYRSLQRRTIKRYLGRTQDLSPARLEEIAERLSHPSSPPPDTGPGQAPHESLHISPSFSSLSLFLESQLRPPPLPLELVERPRLFAQLDAWSTSKLTLLSAPAGFGKTTLVASWLARHRIDAPIAWITLATSDNDPSRFWRVILTACQAWPAPLIANALAQLLSSTQPFFSQRLHEEVVLSFCYAITKQEMRGLLILDDYHVINEPRIHELLGFFLSHLPETLHLVLLTRADPPLPLARWRANAQLHEIGAKDLRFLHDEMALFFQKTSALSFSSETLEMLNTHLEGWPAGLRLLSFSLSGNRTPTEIRHLLATFRGDYRPIRDYFVTEVLALQSESLQDFLLRTSVLPRLSASLCAHVTGRPESAIFLDAMERNHLFLEALDASGEWYRYQPLFAEAMQHEASLRLGEDALRAVLQTASSWFQQHGFLSEALATALQAEAFEQAAPLIENIAQQMHLSEFQEYRTLGRWLEQIPEAILIQHPRLCFSAALTLAFNQDISSFDQGTFPRIEELLQRAEEGWRVSNNHTALGELFAFRAVFSYKQNVQHQALVWAIQALAHLPVMERTWRSLSLRVLGVEALRVGRFNEAFHRFQEIEQYWQTVGTFPVFDGTSLFLGVICLELGELHQAASYFRRILQTTSPDVEAAIATLAQLGEAYVLYEQNALKGVQQHVQDISRREAEAEQALKSLLSAPFALLQARLHYARGETTQAIQSLVRLLSQLRLYADEFHCYIAQEAWSSLVHFSLVPGDIVAARRWFNDFSPVDAPQAETQQLTDSAPQLGTAAQTEGSFVRSTQSGQAPLFWEQRSLLLARLSLAQGETEDALAHLKELLPTMQVTGRKRQIIQIYLLLAQACHAQQQRLQARQWLLEGLRVGLDEGYQRTILDEGNMVVPLLQDLLPGLHDQPLRDYVQGLLQAFVRTDHNGFSAVTPVASTLLEPLSPQEQRVLRKLATGLSNAEIAQALTVSIHTIRSQVQSIYRKLQVKNRHAASEVARALHLL